MNNWCGRRKFIYLHPPKTAGKTLELMLFNQKPKPSTSNHAKLSTMVSKGYCDPHTGVDFKKLFRGQIKGIKTWSIIISVRNPWARMVSTYFQGNIPESNTGIEPTRKKLSFKEWVLHSKNPVQPCTMWLETEMKTFEPDYIIRLESFDDDWLKLPREFKHDRWKDETFIPVTNPSKHEHYSTYYDDETKEYVADKYSKDITRFNYTFDIY